MVSKQPVFMVRLGFGFQDRNRLKYNYSKLVQN